jgi:hypothetical protein
MSKNACQRPQGKTSEPGNRRAPAVRDDVNSQPDGEYQTHKIRQERNGVNQLSPLLLILPPFQTRKRKRICYFQYTRIIKNVNSEL